MESTAVASWAGMVALAIWAASTALLVVAGAFQGELHSPRLWPDRTLLGNAGWQLATNVCAIIPVLTTAFSVQASAPFVVSHLQLPEGGWGRQACMQLGLEALWRLAFFWPALHRRSAAALHE